MSQSIRGKNATIQIVVDGDLKTGSFTKITSFNLKPRQSIDETPFLGEPEDELTYNHKGWDFDFSAHEWDPRVMEVVLKNIDNDRQRIAQPNINIVITTEYFSDSDPSLTLLLENCKIMMGDRAIAGANDFITTSLSGKCKVVTKL